MTSLLANPLAVACLKGWFGPPDRLVELHSLLHAAIQQGDPTAWIVDSIGSELRSSRIGP
jgi:hypothetical protein